MMQTVYYLGSKRLQNLAEEALSLIGGRLRPFREYPIGGSFLVLYGLEKPLPKGLHLPRNLLLLQGSEASPLALGARLHHQLSAMETAQPSDSPTFCLPAPPPGNCAFLKRLCLRRGPWHPGEPILLFPELPSLLWLQRHRRELWNARIFCISFSCKGKKELQGLYPEVPLHFLTMRELKKLLKKPSLSQGSDIFFGDPDLCQKQGQDQIQHGRPTPEKSCRQPDKGHLIPVTGGQEHSTRKDR